MEPSPAESGVSPETPYWRSLALSLGYGPEDIPRLCAIRQEYDQELERLLKVSGDKPFSREYLDSQWETCLRFGL